MPRGRKIDPHKESGPEEEYIMDSAMSEKIERMIDQADKELEEARVNFRWGKEQLDLVKTVATMMGVPYQTYIKQVVYKQCLEDLKLTRELGIKQNFIVM